MRNQSRKSHRNYRKPFVEEGQTVRIVIAEPMCIADTDDTKSGSFMILEASSLAHVEAFHNGDSSPCAASLIAWSLFDETGTSAESIRMSRRL